MGTTSESVRVREFFVFIALAAFALAALVLVSPGGVDAQSVNLAAVDGENSSQAWRLVDGEWGEGPDVAWKHSGNQWQDSGYVWSAILDLGEPHDIHSVEFFSGRIPFPSTATVVFDYSMTTDNNGWSWLTTQTPGYNSWSGPISTPNTQARYIRVRFDSAAEHFNLSEVRIEGDPIAADDGVVDDGVVDDGVGDDGGDGGNTNDPGRHRQATVPSAAGVQTSFKYGEWPHYDLSATCIELHDRYWVQGPGANPALGAGNVENLAYPTWHPATEIHPDTGEICDYGHEHGWDPRWVEGDLFEFSGGMPPFGYVAELANGAGEDRHEDHVGHKVTVAKYRASIGNAAGPGTLYDAGFECFWLSKIHQGSFTNDAFANHLHEYFLTAQCFDGLNAQGVVDNTVVGTKFSVKLLYTFGAPGQFLEENCSGGAVFSHTDINYATGPAPMVMQDFPYPNNGVNDRAFVCAGAAEWNSIEDFPYVDIWNQNLRIQDPNGGTVLQFQPYYMVRNPSRIMDFSAGTPTVVRTIGICYDDNTGANLNRPFCAGNPATEPAWNSPDSTFTGTFRSVNFKALWLQNGGGPTTWCTDPYGQPAPGDTPPCNPGNLLQRATSFDNHHDDGQYSYNGRSGNVAGSIWAEDPFGNVFGNQSNGNGGYISPGIGREFLVDNRNPDDDRNGQPDGANVRGAN